MYISGVNYESLCDGIGVRATIFVSGCLHNCYGCHSPDTHSFINGEPLTAQVIDTINAEIEKRPFLSGITLSGGDCMYSPVETINLLKKIIIPKQNVWCYSGFTYENIVSNPKRYELLKHVDVLVDGQYNNDLRDITLAFKGSSNQRIIDVKKSFRAGEIVLYNYK